MRFCVTCNDGVPMTLLLWLVNGPDPSSLIFRESCGYSTLACRLTYSFTISRKHL